MDDDRFTGTKNYTLATSILRRYHDLLLKTIESWDTFAAGELRYFDNNSPVLQRLWNGPITSLFNDVSELRFLQRSILQKIQTFDRMTDGVSPAGTSKFRNVDISA